MFQFILILYRGLTFREAFARIKVRSAMPSHVGIMALTATATKQVREKVQGLTGMRDPLCNIRSPDKTNMFSSIAIKGYNSYEVSKFFNVILEELKTKLIALPRIIIFCKLKTDCAKLYTFFKVGMGRYFTHPPGAHSSIVECRLVDMFFKGTDNVVKEKIIANFTTSSCLRIVICTDAFGMGIDCCDVTSIIHYGVPGDVETYVQQVGRAGREGQQSYAILLHSKKLMDNCESSIINYVNNTQLCRRDCLLKDLKIFAILMLTKAVIVVTFVLANVVVTNAWTN